MTVGRLARELALETLCVPHPEREVHGAFAGDLLSWVMTHAHADNAWATVMVHNNALAVAALVGVSAIIVCDGREVEPDVCRTAREREINLLRTNRPMCALCALLGKLDGLSKPDEPVEGEPHAEALPHG